MVELCCGCMWLYWNRARLVGVLLTHREQNAAEVLVLVVPGTQSRVGAQAIRKMTRILSRSHFWLVMTNH